MYTVYACLEVTESFRRIKLPIQLEMIILCGYIRKRYA